VKPENSHLAASVHALGDPGHGVSKLLETDVQTVRSKKNNYWDVVVVVVVVVLGV